MCVATSLSTVKSAPVLEETPVQQPVHLPPELLNKVECHLLKMLSDITLLLPMEVSSFTSSVRKTFGQNIPNSVVEDLMYKFSAQMLITQVSFLFLRSELLIELPTNMIFSKMISNCFTDNDFDILNKLNPYIWICLCEHMHTHTS